MKTKLYYLVLEDTKYKMYDKLSSLSKQLDLYFYYQLGGFRLRKNRIDFLNWLENLSMNEFEKVIKIGRAHV